MGSRLRPFCWARFRCRYWSWGVNLHWHVDRFWRLAKFEPIQEAFCLTSCGPGLAIHQAQKWCKGTLLARSGTMTLALTSTIYCDDNETIFDSDLGLRPASSRDEVRVWRRLGEGGTQLAGGSKLLKVLQSKCYIRHGLLKKAISGIDIGNVSHCLYCICCHVPAAEVGSEVVQLPGHLPAGSCRLPGEVKFNNWGLFVGSGYHHWVLQSRV